MDDPRDELEQTRELVHVIMAQQGEPDAFRWLIDRYEQRLLYFVRRIVDDPDRALDVLQEIWITVFRRVRSLKTPAAFRVLLYQIAHNKAINQFRGDRRRKEAAGESIEDSIAEVPDDSESIERIENAELTSSASRTDRSGSSPHSPS